LRKYFDPLLKQLFKKMLKGSLARQYVGKTGVMPPYGFDGTSACFLFSCFYLFIEHLKRQNITLSFIAICSLFELNFHKEKESFTY